VVALPSGNSLVLGPFYGEAQPWAIARPRPLAARLLAPTRERGPGRNGHSADIIGLLDFVPSRHAC
jgi:hypothetical protein